MTETRVHTIALLGNPNCGKSSVFNLLTGLRQKVGNFPGVTVDKKEGAVPLPGGRLVRVIDFPGTYSLYPNAQDERIVVQSLLLPGQDNFPDAILYVADVTRLEQHLLLFSQAKDLGLPMALALNMADVATDEGMAIDTAVLSQQLGVPVALISGRTGEGLAHLHALLQALDTAADSPPQPQAPFYRLTPQEADIASQVQQHYAGTTPYQALLLAHHHTWLPFLSAPDRARIASITEEAGMQPLRLQVGETMARFDRFTPMARAATPRPSTQGNQLTATLDRVLTHRVAGPLIFFAIMFLIFQAIFSWAQYPMDAIDAVFAAAAGLVQDYVGLPWLASLLSDGILAGLGGILVFVPQIAILFFLVTLLEEVGYMARVAFMFDRFMQAFGLNGRSVVSLISSGACAIPAIMSTRTISNSKERLITILVSPLISCSARIPVYTVLIGFAVPEGTVWGLFNRQGLAFMGLYLMGIAAAMLSALAFKWIIKSQERSFLLLELPTYRPPVLRNVGITVWEKVRAFVVEAGKVIMVISVLLWALASYGPPEAMARARTAAAAEAEAQQLPEAEAANLLASRQMEASFAGHLGKFIEPAIQPLGFDWKIGIALITSFAAREVFVGTMATIYSIGSDSEAISVRDRMATERDPLTGKLRYDIATSTSLLLFYVFAMMCMGTLAVVRRETNSWKWPIVQFLFMTGLAYLSSFLAYQWLS